MAKGQRRFYQPIDNTNNIDANVSPNVNINANTDVNDDINTSVNDGANANVNNDISANVNDNVNVNIDDNASINDDINNDANKPLMEKKERQMKNKALKGLYLDKSIIREMETVSRKYNQSMSYVANEALRFFFDELKKGQG